MAFWRDSIYDTRLLNIVLFPADTQKRHTPVLIASRSEGSLR